MYNYPSRSEQRQLKLYRAAEEGKFSLKQVLYSSEIRKLEKKGFIISDIVPFKCGMFTATISWAHAYGESVPHLVYGYITNIIKTIPRNHINSFAQELFVIAQRANIIKNN